MVGNVDVYGTRNSPTDVKYTIENMKRITEDLKVIRNRNKVLNF